MTDLNPEDKALLDLARDGHEPTDADRGRVRAGLVAQLGVGTGLTVTTAVATSAASTGAAGAAGTGLVAGGGTAIAGTSTTLAVTKLIAAVVMAGAIGGGVLAATRAVHAPQAPSVTTSPATAPEQQAEAPRLVERSAGAPAPLATEAPSVLPVDREATPPSPAPARPAVQIDRSKGMGGTRPIEEIARPVVAPPSGVSATPVAESRPDPFTTPAPAALNPQPEVPPSPTAPAAPLTPTTLEAETRLVRAGVAALHAGDPARALALFDEHARSYPNGILAEERTAERVVALCDLGRDAEGRAAAAAFLRDHPHSPLSARVQASCGARSNP